MFRKKLLLCAGLIILFGFGTAFAGTVNIDFAFTGNGVSTSGGAWSWMGGSTPLVSSFDTSASLDASSINFEIVDVTSGSGTGGSFTFGPSATGSITIGGCVAIGRFTSCGTLFSGQFITPQTATNAAGPSVDFMGTDVAGSVSSQLAVALGLTSPNVIGSLTSTLFGAIGSSGGSGLTGSGDLILVGTGTGRPPVPEPSSFFLIGSGLVGLLSWAKSKRR
jgi:PEP-CTERM motif